MFTFRQSWQKQDRRWQSQAFVWLRGTASLLCLTDNTLIARGREGRVSLGETPRAPKVSRWQLKVRRQRFCFHRKSKSASQVLQDQVLAPAVSPGGAENRKLKEMQLTGAVWTQSQSTDFCQHVICLHSWFLALRIGLEAAFTNKPQTN